MLTGDVGRTAIAGPRGPPRRRRADAVPPAQVHARVAGGGRGRDHRPARARRSGSRTSTTGSAPSSTGAGDEVRLYSRDLHDISGQFPEVVAGARGLPWAGILDGELLAWKDGVVLPFLQLQARLGRKNPSAKILADVPVIFVAWDVLGLDADQDRVVAPLLDEPLTDRRRRLEAPRPAARERGRRLRAQLPRLGRLRRRARGGVRPGPRSTQRGAHGQGPAEPVLTGPARARLAEDEEGAGDDRLRGGRRRGRARQAPRRPVGLHVRGARRRDRRPRHHRQGVQRADGRGDRRDDACGSRPTRSRPTAATGWSSRPWSSRSPST